MGLGISSVGIPEISSYTKSEQPRIAGKHLTRQAKNGYAAVAILHSLRPMGLQFLVGSATAATVARYYHGGITELIIIRVRLPMMLF